MSEGKAHAVVEPSLVAKASPLARVSGSENLVVSTGEFGGDIAFSGRGAGGNPTAVAVVSDLLQAAQYGSTPSGRPYRGTTIPHVLTSDLELPQYVRFVVRTDRESSRLWPSVLSRYHINLDAVLQRPGYSKSELPFVVTLEPCKESRVQAALAESSSSTLWSKRRSECRY